MALLQRNTHNIISKPSAHKYKMLITKIYNSSILSCLPHNYDQFELPVEQHSPFRRKHSQLPLLCPSGRCEKRCLFSVSVWVPVVAGERKVLRDSERVWQSIGCVSLCFWVGGEGGCILQFCLWHKQTAWLLPLLVVWVFCACVSLTASVICAFSSPGFAYPWQTLCTFLFVRNNWCSLTWINRETTDVATLAAIINTANVGRWFW